MSLRAAIRANVLLARPARVCHDKANVMRSARAYFELAKLAIRPPEPTLIAIGSYRELQHSPGIGMINNMLLANPFRALCLADHTILGASGHQINFAAGC